MKTALLVVDVQQGLCTGPWAVADIDSVVDRINPLARKVRAAGGTVVLIQHEEADGPVRHGTAGWQLYGRVETQPGDVRIRKTASDAFHETELQATLQARGIQRLLVTGLQSELCVDSTVRAALSRRYPVVVVADAHTTMASGALTAEQIVAHHNVALANVASPGTPVTVVPAAEIVFDA